MAYQRDRKKGKEMKNMPSEKSDGAAEKGEQYSLARILGIWALAAVPMGIPRSSTLHRVCTLPS
jgi:hypothetical protein